MSTEKKPSAPFLCYSLIIKMAPSFDKRLTVRIIICYMCCIDMITKVQKYYIFCFLLTQLETKNTSFQYKVKYSIQFSTSRTQCIKYREDKIKCIMYICWWGDPPVKSIFYNAYDIVRVAVLYGYMLFSFKRPLSLLEGHVWLGC